MKFHFFTSDGLKDGLKDDASTLLRSTLDLRLFIKARPLLLRWAWPSNGSLTNKHRNSCKTSKQGNIDHNFRS